MYYHKINAILGFSLKTFFLRLFPMPNNCKTIAYLRVSTIDQNCNKNRADILQLANKKELGQVTFVEEKASGKISWRKRKIANILEQLSESDHLIVSELSRLGRSMLECMEILSIAMQKGINVYAVKGNWHLDKSIQSKIIAAAFSMAAEIELDLISKRTTEALRAKKVAGVPLGRPKGPGKSKLDRYKEEIIALLNNGATKKFIASRYSTTPANLHNWVNKHAVKRLFNSSNRA
jgi:DNA invertase Pin-like site-specific DNA recombinase